MKLRLPTSVKIGAKRFHIKFAEHVRSNGEEVCATINHQKAVITLSRAWAKSEGELLDSFLHECLHGMVRALRLDMDEETVQRLAFLLAAFLSDNKLLRTKGGKA
jgi:hypothetical protein